MQWKVNRKWRVMLIVLVVLVCARLALPYWMTRYVNDVLSDLNGYRGTVQDVDIHLLRGAYTLDSLQIYKLNGNADIPFLQVPHTELSIEWEALLNGAFVGQIEFSHPAVNFIGSRPVAPDSSHATPQTGKEVDWNKPLEKLMPLDINRISVHDGKVVYHDLSTDPKVSVFLHNIQMDALNLTNAKQNPEELPSRVYLQALSSGNGQLNIAMKMNAQAATPDFDMDLQFENVDMKAFNSLFKAYAAADIREGTFNLYSEMAVKDGAITGYVRPLFNGLKVPAVKQQTQVMTAMWESMVEHLATVFEKQKKDQFATRVVIEEELVSDNIPFWPSVWATFSGAFGQAFESNPEAVRIAAARPTDLQAVEQHVEEEKSRKEIRRERRKEKREQRRRERRERKLENAEKAAKKESKDNS